MTSVNQDDIKLEFEESPQFTQLEGLQKTYAHYLLFKENSPTLKAIIEVFVPDDKEKQELFMKMFTVLNKKHVKAGLQQFGAIKNLGFSGFSELKHAAMTTYFENPFNTMDREIYENKILIDAIHEAVINYFPNDGAISTTTDEEDKKMVKEARVNLQKSLQGYVGKRNAYIEAPENPPTNIDDLKTKIDKIKKKVILPNVLHLEAVSELHRHAFLTVDKKDALELIADAHASVGGTGKKLQTPSQVSSSTPEKTLYLFNNDEDKYMVSGIKLNDTFKKYTKKNNGCWTKEEGESKGGTKKKYKSTKKTRSK
jgi:hypothetical protein